MGQLLAEGHDLERAGVATAERPGPGDGAPAAVGQSLRCQRRASLDVLWVVVEAGEHGDVLPGGWRGAGVLVQPGAQLVDHVGGPAKHCAMASHSAACGPSARRPVSST